MIKTYLLNVDELEDPVTNPEWMALLSVTRREKVLRFRKMSDRKQSAGAGLLLEYALKQEEIREGESSCFFNELGKPCHEKIHFNVSHSGKWVFCVVSDRPVGCDIQKKVKIGDRLAKRICGEQEKKYLNRIAEEEERQQTLQLLWALKESYVKMTGEGICRNLATVQFSFENPFRICCDGVWREEKAVAFWKEDNVLAVCAWELPEKMEEVNLTTVYKKLII